LEKGWTVDREDGQRMALPEQNSAWGGTDVSIAQAGDRMTLERGGQAGWCGPAVVALATGCGYARACALLRQVAPERYDDSRDIVTAYWRDVMAALAASGLAARELALRKPGGRGPTLLGLVRQGGVEGDAGATSPQEAGLRQGLYLVRVTGHFLLLAAHGFGLAQVHDNRLSGAVLSVRSHGLCRVTHLARLPAG
jgi:hypothetical protein